MLLGIASANAESQSRTLFELGNLAEIYFADRVVLCEGKTDRRLLPLPCDRLYHQPPDLDHIALVSLGSCADIPRAIPVLAAMVIAASAVVDLDLCYTPARSGGLLPRDGDDLANVKSVLERLQADYGFPLHDNGLPKNDKPNGWLAADARALVADDDEANALAQQTVQDLQEKRVWAWLDGCIQQVTGTDKRGKEATIEQEERLRNMSATEIEREMPAFKAFFGCIRSV